MNYCNTEAEKIEKDRQKLSGDLLFMKQTIGNACGTMGVIHAVANIKKRLDIILNSIFEKFYLVVKDLSPENKSKKLETNTDISELHEQFPREGQSATLEAEKNVDLHFLALALVDGNVYEFNGWKPFPVNHGMSSSDTFLSDAAKVCQKFMARDKIELRFTIVALSEMS